MKADLYIIAAGNGSRMGGNLPKPLVQICDEPNITTILKQIGHKFNHVFVITNILSQDKWGNYYNSVDKKLLSNVVNIPIVSGYGDGHALLNGMIKAEEVKNISALSDNIVTCWGDVFIPNSEIIDELLSLDMTGMSGIIPAVNKPNPYVTLLTDDNLNCISADFSKYGEKHDSGFHDQSIFRFSRHHVKLALIALHTSLWKNGRYMVTGGELSTLFTFHSLYNQKQPVKVYTTDYPTMSFNSIEEVKHIQQELNNRKKELI